MTQAIGDAAVQAAHLHAQAAGGQAQAAHHAQAAGGQAHAQAAGGHTGRAKAVHTAAQGVATHARAALQALKAGATVQETSLGLLLFAFIYLLAWTSGLAKASEEAEGGLSAWRIMATLITSLGGTWFMALVLLVTLLILDKVLTVTVFQAVTPQAAPALTAQESLACVRLAFSWCMNLRIFKTLASAMLLTLLFAMFYVKWMELRRVGPSARQTVVRDVFLFNLVIMAAMAAGQLWLDVWWGEGGA